jgi:chemotaxis response regulator CheB
MGAQKIIDRFVDIGILSVKDKDVKYGKVYVYREYLDMFVDREKY